MTMHSGQLQRHAIVFKCSVYSFSRRPRSHRGHHQVTERIQAPSMFGFSSFFNDPFLGGGGGGPGGG